jgi:tetratricopeptide (TPR) repeat protein
MQAAFRPDQVRIVGEFNDYARISDEADKKEHVFHFCPACGSQVFYTEPTEPDLMVVSVGSFADPSFPPPTESGYDWRRHPWLALPDTIERFDTFAPLRLLYEAGEHAEAADRAQELIAANPEDARLLYNVACCESLAGRTEDAVEHVRRAIELAGEVRELAAGDPDFDPIRGEPGFRELVG